MENTEITKKGRWSRRISVGKISVKINKWKKAIREKKLDEMEKQLESKTKEKKII